MPANGPVTWDTVKRLFTGADIAYMKMRGWKLDDYADVARNFRVLIGEIKSRKMPPKPFEPWSADMIDTFQAWKDGGFKKSIDASADVSTFIAMSEFLTGFDDLHENPDLAVKYLERLSPEVLGDPDLEPRPEDQGGVNQQDFKDLLGLFAQGDTAAFEAALEQARFKKVAQTVILLWYTAAFIKLESPFAGFPAGVDSTGQYGPPHDDNRYVSGLVWRAIKAHPMGFSAEGYRDGTGDYSLAGRPYWEFPPGADGTNTGLGPESFTP